DAQAFRRMRFNRLSIIGDDDRLEAFELEPENPCGCGIDQPQANALAASDWETVGNAAVDGHGIADPPRHSPFHRVVETCGDRAVPLQPEVAEHPDDVTIDGWRLKLFDDERSSETTTHPLGAMSVWVVPIRSCVR